MDNQVRRASSRGTEGAAADKEMVEGRSIRGWEMAGKQDRNAAGGGSMAAAGKYLSALCFRSLGGSMATESSARRHDRSAVCGRCCAGIRAERGSGAVSERTAGTAGSIWLGTAPGEDAADRVWAERSTESRRSRRRKTGDVRLSGIYAHVREEQEDGLFCGESQDGEEADAGEAAGLERGASTADARTDCGNRKMA